MGSRAGNRPWLWQWPSLRMMKLGNGVRLGLLQTSLGNDHGVLCRYRRFIGKRQLMRCGRNRANREAKVAQGREYAYCQHLDQPENGKADDQELDDGVEKNTE